MRTEEKGILCKVNPIICGICLAIVCMLGRLPNPGATLFLPLLIYVGYFATLIPYFENTSVKYLAKGIKERKYTFNMPNSLILKSVIFCVIIFINIIARM